MLEPTQARGPVCGQIRHNQTQMPAADKAFFQVLQEINVMKRFIFPKP